MDFPGGTGEMESGISVQGLNKNNWEFPGVVKNKLFGIFKVLGFIQALTQFCGDPRGR